MRGGGLFITAAILLAYVKGIATPRDWAGIADYSNGQKIISLSFKTEEACLGALQGSSERREIPATIIGFRCGQKCENSVELDSCEQTVFYNSQGEEIRRTGTTVS